MSRSGARVLLVEDDVTLNDAFSLLLRNNDYHVDTAMNGEEALVNAHQNPPDLILLDLLMPIMDGKEFLKEYENSNNVPIIIFSNLDAKNEVDTAMSLGATKYILKAWASPKQLLKIVDDLLASRQN